MKIETIRNSLAARESLQKSEYHQAILDVAYADWQQNKGWTYGDTVNNAAEKLGAAAKLFILIGKYNEQTCNGGHLQYMDNGYADGEGGCFRKHDPEMPLHKEMIQLFREFKLTLLPHGKEVLGILESFRVEVSEGNEACSECGGSGEGEPGEDCSNCGGSGEQEADGSILNQDESGKLDDRYYAISEVWMAELNQHLGQWFATGQDPFANETAPAVPKTCIKPRLKLTGTDGNAFAVLGRATDALKAVGCPKETVDEYLKKAQSGDYNHLLATTCEYCEVS